MYNKTRVANHDGKRVRQLCQRQIGQTAIGSEIYFRKQVVQAVETLIHLKCVHFFLLHLDVVWKRLSYIKITRLKFAYDYLAASRTAVIINRKRTLLMIEGSFPLSLSLTVKFIHRVCNRVSVDSCNSRYLLCVYSQPLLADSHVIDLVSKNLPATAVFSSCSTLTTTLEERSSLPNKGHAR